MTNLGTLGDSGEAEAVVLRRDDASDMSPVGRAVGVGIGVLTRRRSVVSREIVAEAEETAGPKAGSDRGGEVEYWVEIIDTRVDDANL
jgi:hypothetical protein